MKYNNELKNIDTEAKAYLLGFIYGDGSISNYFEKSGRERFLTRISIQHGDVDIIRKLKKEFSFFNVGAFDYSIYNENSGFQVSIRKSSKTLFQDLKSNGVYPRKSYENKELLKVPGLPNNLLNHFVRGLWDADGSFYVQKTRPNLLRSELCSASKNLIVEIRELLEERNIKPWKIRKKTTNKNPFYCIEFTQKEEVQKLIEFLYTDATIFLKRKKEKAFNHEFVNKVLDRSIKCPKCKSEKTWRNGSRGPSIRMKCHVCKKGFSIKKAKFQALIKPEELRETPQTDIYQPSMAT